MARVSCPFPGCDEDLNYSTLPIHMQREHNIVQVSLQQGFLFSWSDHRQIPGVREGLALAQVASTGFIFLFSSFNVEKPDRACFRVVNCANTTSRYKVCILRPDFYEYYPIFEVPQQGEEDYVLDM